MFGPTLFTLNPYQHFGPKLNPIPIPTSSTNQKTHLRICFPTPSLSDTCCTSCTPPLPNSSYYHPLHPPCTKPIHRLRSTFSSNCTIQFPSKMHQRTRPMGNIIIQTIKETKSREIACILFDIGQCQRL